MTKVREMIERLKTENLSLHGDSVAERVVNACALVDNTRLQQERKKAA